ncbi:MAG: hypothetical protein IKV89_04725, partial [Clostridia bacterium]|nr:hypothetical protein [Clostridia bacterium]
RSNMKRIVVLFSVVLLLFSLCACGSDWSFELINGYSIERINSHSIILKKDGQYVITNFFVTSFQIHEPFVCIKGIKTLNRSATEEEIRARVTVCYLINTETGELTGPYENEEDFRAYCKEVGVTMDELWMPASGKVSDQFKEVS